MPGRILLFAILCAPSVVAAQDSGPYRLPPGDTIRYREVTNGETIIRTPQGDLVSTSEHDATIGVVGAGEGVARAWFEALRLRAVGPTGDQSPSTAELIGRPYELAFPASGDVEVLGVPEFPAAVAAITDLTHQFFDFFAALPAVEPSNGYAWVDTIRSQVEGGGLGSQFNESIRRFQVRGDTILNGSAAKVIDVAATLRMEATGPVEGQPMTLTTVMQGGDAGVLIFDWNSGRLLFRSRTGEMNGTLRIHGGPQPMEFPQLASYASTIETLP